MIRVAAIQLAFSYAVTPHEFFDRVRGPVERAAQEDARLIALPNYAGLMLLGAIAPAAVLSEQWPLIQGVDRKRLTDALSVLREFYVHLFGSLAEKLNVYLVPGTIVEREGDAFYNAAYLFGPDGRVIGSQRQTHRTRDEIVWGLAQGDTLAVFDVGIARVGLVIGEDVAYPEVARILALQGANLLIHPAAYATWSNEHFLLDLWRDVQSNQVFGLQACLAGRGRSAVYAPVEMTEGQRGILAQAAQPTAEETVSAALDFDARQRVIERYPIFDFFNCDFYAREFPGIYGNT
ncbi:MAG: hypothetical protein HY782_06295 [Chloroflexi bacterium]|nr:hypothetical protein [Chloroflexota bacterium]